MAILRFPRVLPAVCSLVALAALAAQPAVAQPAAPVQITSCKVLQYVNTPRHPYWYWAAGPVGYGAPVTDGIEISYVNRASVKATRVAFAVNYRGANDHIVDVGTFSPGTTIDHSFGNFTGFAYLGARPNACSVVAVRFADGTAWRNPRRQATNP